MNTEPNQNPSTGLQENLACALCYIPIVALVFLFIEKNSKKVKYHAIQSLLTIVCLSVVSFALGIITSIIRLYFISYLFSLAIFGVFVYLFIMAYQNKDVKIPVISEQAEKFAGK